MKVCRWDPSAVSTFKNYFVHFKLYKTFNRELIKCCKEEEKQKQTSAHNDIEKKKTCTVDSIKAQSSLTETQQTSTPLVDPIGKREKEEKKKRINSSITGAKNNS